MNKSTTIREKWDKAFAYRGIWGPTLKVLGAVLLFIAVGALMDFAVSMDNYPLEALVNSKLIILFQIGMAILFYIAPQFATFAYGLVLIFTLGGASPILVMAAALTCWIACSNAPLICIIAIALPLCVINSPDSGNFFLHFNQAYFIFAIGGYTAGKLGNGTWKYAFPIFFSLMAIIFDVYGNLISAKSNFWSSEGLFNPTGELVQIVDILPQIIVICLINVVICYVFYKLLNLDYIRFAEMQLDLREGICFVILMAMLVVSRLIVSAFLGGNGGMEIGQIVLQVIIAFALTRLIASYQICSLLKMQSLRKGEYTDEEGRLSPSVARTLEEEILETVGLYVNPKLYNKAVSIGETPLNVVLLFGERELDKSFVIENLKKKTNTEFYLTDGNALADEFRETNDFTSLLNYYKGNALTIIFVNHFNALFDGPDAKKKAERINMHFDANVKNDKVFFIVAADDVNSIPRECFSKSRIGKAVFADLTNTITFRDTYSLLSQIGQGGSGAVYKAYHQRLKEIVVLKRVVDRNTKTASSRNEVDLLKKIKHMNLPKVYDVFIEDGYLYTVMDYVEGKSLQEILDESGRISEEKVIFWAKQLADAVEYLHTFKPPIIHSDIKPGNIMVTLEGNACLIDFNVSLMFGRGNSKAIAVTPGYSPIEQYGDIRKYEKTLLKHGYALPEDSGLLTDYAGYGIGEWSDIYSIGATLYHMVTGVMPDLNYSQIKPLDECAPDCSRTLAAIIETCMEIDPQERYENAAALKRALENC